MSDFDKYKIGDYVTVKYEDYTGNFLIIGINNDFTNAGLIVLFIPDEKINYGDLEREKRKSEMSDITRYNIDSKYIGRDIFVISGKRIINYFIKQNCNICQVKKNIK